MSERPRHAAAFIDALGIKRLDALGFSMGGLIAQQLTIDRPDLVRNEKVAQAQVAALQKWGAPTKDPYAYLKTITQPALVVNGRN